MFSLSFNKKTRDYYNKYVKFFSVQEYMNYESLSNIKVELTTEDDCVELKLSQNNYSVKINKAPVQKVVKISANFKASVNNLSTTKSRIYYLNVKADENEFNAVARHKEYGIYRLEKKYIDGKWYTKKEWL